MTCLHQNKHLTRRVVASGAVQYVEQCLDCGVSLNQPMAHWKVRKQFRDEEPPDYDESIINRLAERSRQESEQRRTEWFDDYGVYLRSAGWQELRQKVFRRARGLCEGCADRPPTEVHHLTYEHVKSEFLFELVALCEQCHERAHTRPLVR